MKQIKDLLPDPSSFGNYTPKILPKGEVIGLVYARVSSKKQETEGAGLQTQEERCKQYLKNEGVYYDQSFLDSFTGGGDFLNRPAMSEMLKYIDDHPHQKFLVVFDDLKRFARDVEFHLKLRTAFKARNVELRCLNHNFDDSPEGRFVEVVLAGQAQLDREQNRRQVIQKQKARLELGYWPFGAKRGYKMVKDPNHGKISIIDNTFGPVLKEALEGFAYGVFSNKLDVCKFLVEKGFWTKQRAEKYTDKLTLILRDPFYAGYVEYIPWEVSRRKGRHEKLIASEVFDLIQERLNPCRSNKIRSDASKDFPLRGLVVCDCCGKHLTAGWSKGRKNKYPYYFCQNGHCEMYGKTCSKNRIENDFTELLSRQKLKPEVSKLVEILFEEVWNKEIKDFNDLQSSNKSKVSSLKRDIEQLTRLAVRSKSETVRKVYEDQIEVESDKIRKIEESMYTGVDFSVPYRTALEKAITFLKEPYSIWSKVEDSEKHRLFFFIFDEKLAYSKDSGYRTGKNIVMTRLFEEFVLTNPQDVEMAGLNPRVKGT